MIMSEQSAFNEVVRIVTELNVPIAEITALCDLIGRKNVVKGLRSQGEGKFKETLLVFYKIGIEKCVNYISILNDKEVIGQNHISHDFARAPYSIARTLQFLDNKDIEIKDLYIIVPRLKNAVGERSFERGFPSWSLYYFFVTIKKVKTIGVDKAVRIILMLKDLFGQEHLEGAYEQGYLWFVEAIEIFFQIGISKSRKLIEDFRDRSNIHYFNTAFAHNPRSFARYIKLKSEAPDKEIDFVIAERKVNSGKIIALLHGLLEEHFDDGEYLCLTSSEFIAFVFDAVTKYFEGEKNEKIAIFLKNKYFSGLAKRNVYSLLRSIGPEIEVQKGLKTYDVETAHMAAFFFLVETSGDALIEFPLGPANYHGSLSEIVRSMSKISIGKELLIPRNKVIPLDVSISLPPQLIHKVEFQKKATLLRVVNDLLYTADIRFATAFQAEPQDQSGIRFKKGLAKGIGSKGSDLAENRSGNLITDDGEKSVAQPLIAHEVSFKFYQMIYTALAASFMEESKKKELEKKLAGIYLNFERQVLGILKEEKVDYLIGIASNENLAFIEFSNARKGNMNITVRLDDAVQHYLSLINREILKEALRERVRQFSGDKRDVESEIKSEIKRQKDIDVKYGEALETAFGGIGVGRKNRG